MSIQSSLLVINSKERTSDSKSSTNFEYAVGQAISVKKIDIKSISIPVTQYNILQGENTFDVLITNPTPTLHTFTAIVGQYTLSHLIEEIESFFSGLGTTVTLIQNPITFKLQLTSSNPVEFIHATPVKLLNTLGLTDSAIPNTSQNVIDFDIIPSLYGLYNYYVLTKVLSQGSNGLFNSGVQQALQTNVSIDVPFGFVQRYEPTVIETNSIIFAKPVNIQFIDIKIVDVNLNEVDLNGSEIELVYKLYVDNNRF